MVWVNGPLIVYHGTDEASANAILHGIDLAVCSRFDVDFGPGFYVTSLMTEARYWAAVRARPISARAAIVAFDIERDEIARFRDHLAFVLPSDDFFDFVRYNRVGNLHHARSGERHYDLVYGPVSRHPEREPMSDMDQICCLSRAAVDCLKRARLEYVGMV
jgi:hypothetical protein